jgi:hypothetical protein
MEIVENKAVTFTTRNGNKNAQRYRTVEDVLRNTRKDGDCMLWLGGVNKDGYGACNARGIFRSQLVHREVFRLINGYAPEVVMHTCDTPLCVNPTHLKAGTHVENMRDMDAKKRRATGAKNGNAKFSDEDIAAMRQMKENGCTYAAVAMRFGVSRGYIWKVLAGQYRSTPCK